jgi:curli production assembly/transport component CsgG
LIIEGARDGIWHFSDREKGRQLIKRFDERYNRNLSVRPQISPKVAKKDKSAGNAS